MDENTYTLPALSAADINGIITAGQDGTYNIAYTNLTANQIAEIGAAFEQTMQTNLKPVAINNGDYNDLTSKPEIPSGYTQSSSFNKVAFSGNYNDLDQNTKPALTNWPNDKPAFNKVAFSGSYNDLSNLPNLNASANNSSISGLANVALSGNYEDLNGAPTLPEDISENQNAFYILNEGTENEFKTLRPLKVVAFTNDYNDLNNKPNFLNTVLQISDFNGPNQEDNIILHILGDQEGYIANFDQIQTNNNIFLKDVIINITNNHLSLGKSTYIKNDNMLYFIDAIKENRVNDNINYIQFSIHSVLTNFVPYTGSNFNAQTELNNLVLTIRQSSIIFDYINNTIYCKIKNG